MKSISSWRQQQARTKGEEVHALRLIGVSATVPNLSDVGEWLGASPCNTCVHITFPVTNLVPIPFFVCIPVFASMSTSCQSAFVSSNVFV